MRPLHPDVLSHWDGEPTRVWESMWGIPHLVALDRVTSTSERLRELGPDAPEFTTVVAEEQVAGRGRNGTEWVSPRGGLWFSVVHRPRLAGAGPLVPLRAGLAAARAIRGITGVDVRIKWPNDLWVRDRKLGGILVEGRGGTLTIGVGVNLATPPGGDTLRTPPVGLRDVAPASVSRSEVLGAILRSLRDALGRGGAALREDEHGLLAALDVLCARRIRVEPGPTGVARGIDRAGRLTVETPDGLVPVSSGTIELL